MVSRAALEHTAKRMISLPLRTTLVKMRTWLAVVVLLLALLVLGAWPQNQPQAPAGNKNVDNLGLQVEAQKDGQNQDQPQTAPAQTPAGEGARATQETVVSSKEAKELFRSVDEILKFASQDTGLPIKHEVKRRLTKRSEVQSYIKKSMKDDKDAKRLERS